MPNYKTMYIEKDATAEEVVEIFGKLLHQLNALMNNFDSYNIRRISTDKTTLKSDDGLCEISGSKIIMRDIYGEVRLEFGYSKSRRRFEFTLYNDNGEETLNLTDNGDAVFSGEISAGSTINVDTDISVGNNIYIGSGSQGSKKIEFFKSDTQSPITGAYISATKDDITDLRIMAGKIGTGILWLLTGGVFGIGWLVDFIMVCIGNFKDKNGNPWVIQ